MMLRPLSKRRWGFVSWGVSMLLLLSTAILRDYAVICAAIAVVLLAVSLGLMMSSERAKARDRKHRGRWSNPE